jgi:uncharacterized damage-inducible protein DinB/RimJ/RimL family protein N-acetyltransferase
MTSKTIVNLQPHLVGELVELRPLQPQDWDALFAAASDPLIWEQHPARDRYQEPVFRDFFNAALEEPQQGGGAFVVIDRVTARIIGSTRYHAHKPEARNGKGEIEIGWTFLARSIWGGEYNREMKRLMLDYIFQFVDRVIFLIGPNNIRSQTAIQRIGATNTGEIEESTDRLGRPIVHLKFAIEKPATSRAAAMNFLKIYNCNLKARERIFDVIRSLSPEQYHRQFTIGMKTLGSTLTHIMLAEWAYMQRVKGEDLPPYDQWPIQYENPPSFDVIEKSWATQATHTRNIIQALRDWDREFTYINRNPPKTIRTTATPADVVTQMLLHEVHHRAQLMAMLRELDKPIENLDYAYFAYKREDISE